MFEKINFFPIKNHTSLKIGIFISEGTFKNN